MDFIKENGDMVEGIVHNYEMGNDGWYYFEPEELPESWVETMIIELENGYELEVGDIITINGSFIDYHPKCGIFDTTGEFRLRVTGKRKEYYYLEGVD